MDNFKLLNTMLDDRYDMQEVIGIGGMAVIYKALDTRLNRYVAIKVLKEEYATDPSLYADFTSESQAVAMLSVKVRPAVAILIVAAVTVVAISFALQLLAVLGVLYTIRKNREAIPKAE